MKTIVLPPLLLLALLLQDVAVTDAQAAKPSASCNPWSANYRGDVRIATQAEADEYTCFRRIIGSLTVVQSSATPIVMPKLRGVIGDLHIVFARTHEHAKYEPARALQQLMPMLESVTGHITLEYRGDALLSDVADRQLSSAIPCSASTGKDATRDDSRRFTLADLGVRFASACSA